MKESVIFELKKALETSDKPIIRSLHRNSHFKTLVLGFNNGTILTSHTAKWPSKLTVLEGSVTYIQNNEEFLLQKYDEKEITVNIEHSVVANKDSLCLLTQSKPENKHQ